MSRMGDYAIEQMDADFNDAAYFAEKALQGAAYRLEDALSAAGLPAYTAATDELAAVVRVGVVAISVTAERVSIEARGRRVMVPRGRYALRALVGIVVGVHEATIARAA